MIIEKAAESNLYKSAAFLRLVWGAIIRIAI